MKIINLSEENNIICQYLAELRDVNVQNDRMRFRNNVRRIGNAMAYEVSKSVRYKKTLVTTPLETTTVSVLDDDIVIGTVFRAGLPLHEGFLDVFDKAGNAFVSAYRYYTDRDCSNVGVHIEYIATPDLTGKTLMLVDPMLATGESMELAYQALVTKGQPQHIHVASVIATDQAIEVVRKRLPSHKTTVWTCDIDHELNEHSYIIPGLGDAGDLLYGEKE